MKSENWNSRLGVILAVAGSAVGLGNFLKFPGASRNVRRGVVYDSLRNIVFVVGLPIAMAEWTMGRHGGLTATIHP